MKKLTIIFLVFICILSLFACGVKNDGNSSSIDENSLFSSDESGEDISKEKLDVISLKAEMLPYLESVSSVDDIELNGFNPWSAELELDTMPVMKNSDKLLTTLDATKKANEIALRLGLAIGAANVNESSDGGFWVGLACSEGLQTVSISVNEMGTVSIVYMHENGKAVPEEYKDNKQDWLIQTYAPLFFEGETVKFGNGDFGAIYKKGDNDKENIINYFFNNVNFAENLNLDMISTQTTYTGTLLSVTAKCSDSYTALDYPIISYKTAKELFLEGKCYTRTMAKPNEKRIVSMALMYETSIYNSYDKDGLIIPYYCFWVEAEEDSQTRYCPFFVPAIAPEYLDTSAIDVILNGK